MNESQLATTEPSVAMMLHGALANIQSGAITPEHVDVLGKMMDLYERNEKRQAEKDFAAALAALQAEMPNIQAVKSVPNKDGTLRYRYAPFEEIMTKARGFLAKHQFSIGFDTEVADGRVTSICHLTHAGGHTKPTRYAVRIGHGPPGSSESQQDGAAYTYAKRGALCAALNIVVEAPDDDARNEGSGETITEDEAKELFRRVKACGADDRKFLDFAGAGKFEEIAASKLQSLLDLISRKEREKAAKANPEKDWSKEPDLL